MKKFLFFVLAWTLACGVARADTAAQLEAWYKGYAAHWLKADVNIAETAKYYASPFYYLSSAGPSLDTEESIKQYLQGAVADWKAKGWTGSALKEIKVRMLNEKSAMILTKWHIHDASGASIIGCDKSPWTYLATKTDAGWKFALEVEIPCGQGLELK